MNSDFENSFSGKQVMITGGLGMIGSTLANRLVEYGARVTIVDSCMEQYGANFNNVDAIKDLIHVNITDIRDRNSMKVLVKDKDIIFNLAGQVSHNDSIDDPFLDADINYLGHLNILENLRKYNPEVLVLYAGSRLQFGRIKNLPVNEEHPLQPKTPYALNKTAAEKMYLFYNEMYNIKFVIFRIANPYGPRSQMKHSRYSMVNWFIRQAMESKVLKIFGDGDQIRDYIYVNDLADAFLHASVNRNCYDKIFNVGSGVGTTFRDMVNNVIEIVGSGKIEYVSWPENYINVETGDYITDISKLCNLASWRPKTDIKNGINLTHQYYSHYQSVYW